MGLFDGLFRRPKPETASPAAPEPKTPPPAPEEDRPLRYQVGNLQGIGRRERQEDSFVVLNAADPEKMTRQGLLAAVCDGMGGMLDGKTASECAAAVLRERFPLLEDPETKVPGWFYETACLASDRVFRLSGGLSGSALAAVHIRDDLLHWAGVGDSAIFLARDGGIFQLNREHNCRNQLFELELDREVIDKQRVLTDPDAPRLSSFIGMDPLAEADLSLRPLPLRRGDGILLCSDGVSGVLTRPELLEAMALSPEEGCALLEQMIQEKNLRAQDNYTGIIISCT